MLHPVIYPNRFLYPVLLPFEQFFPPIPVPVPTKADLPILPPSFFFFFLWEANRSKTVLIHGEKSEGSTWDPVSSCILPFKPVLILNAASLVVQLVNNPPARQIAVFDPWVGKITWRRERLPTPVFWPGEFHGLYSPCGHKESDMTEHLWLSFILNRDDFFKSSFFLQIGINNLVKKNWNHDCQEKYQ